MCVSACSSPDVNAASPPFVLLDYAMRRDESPCDRQRRKMESIVVTVAVLRSKQETRETKRYTRFMCMCVYEYGI